MEFIRSETMFDSAWMSEKLGKQVKSVKKSERQKMGGLSGEMQFIDIEFADGSSQTVLLKKAPEGKSDMRVLNGTAREAIFYAKFAPALEGLVAKSYWSHGDMATGEMAVLMECLPESLPAGVFFGSGNPNNWGIKDKIDELCKGNPDAVEITKKSFALYAKMHAEFWQSPDILNESWLNGYDVKKGEGKERWLGAHDLSKNGWEKHFKDIQAGTSYIEWDDHLVKCLNVSFGKIDWDVFQSELASRPYSLVHGDAHPHNMLWTNMRTPEASLKLIDFEMVGIGSPAQELGQYLISHMNPTLRRSVERELVQGYLTLLNSDLVAKGAEPVSEERCFQEMIDGGFGRWAWFMGGSEVFFGGRSPLGTKLTQFFHDQCAAFARDHIKDPITSPMPRV
jgi:hypothetical protein